jgi:hypothetical protein
VISLQISGNNCSINCLLNYIPGTELVLSWINPYLVMSSIEYYKFLPYLKRPIQKEWDPSAGEFSMGMRNNVSKWGKLFVFIWSVIVVPCLFMSNPTTCLLPGLLIGPVIHRAHHILIWGLSAGCSFFWEHSFPSYLCCWHPYFLQVFTQISHLALKSTLIIILKMTIDTPMSLTVLIQSFFSLSYTTFFILYHSLITYINSVSY